MLPDSSHWEKLGALLKKERQQKKMTQARVAKQLFIERSLISKIEHGKARIPVLFMIEYCRLFKISASNLIKEMEIYLSKSPVSEEQNLPES